MKLYKKIILGVAVCISLSACTDWLDVNTNPNTPISTDAEFHQRMPWMQYYMSLIAILQLPLHVRCYDKNDRNGSLLK